jgi:hypothetical protein
LLEVSVVLFRAQPLALIEETRMAMAEAESILRESENVRTNPNE